MSTEYGAIQGLMLDIEPLISNVESTVVTGEYAVAKVSFTVPAFTSGDTIELGAGGYDRGVATTATLAAMIQNERRDGKTVVIKAAMLYRPGSDGTTLYYCGAITVSAGNLTFSPTAFDESTGATGVITQPMAFLVRYALQG